MKTFFAWLTAREHATVDDVMKLFTIPMQLLREIATNTESEAQRLESDALDMLYKANVELRAEGQKARNALDRFEEFLGLRAEPVAPPSPVTPATVNAAVTGSVAIPSNTGTPPADTPTPTLVAPATGAITGGVVPPSAPPTA